MRRASIGVGVVSLAGLLVAAPARTARGGDAPPAVESVKVATARGVALEATLHRPAKANGTAVVLAPGQTGGRDRPIVKRTAEGLAAAGFTVLRFDWAYFTAKGKPAEDLAPEVADLDAAVAHAKKLPGVSKVLLGGKSLGVMAIVERLAKTPDDAAALLLLTPPLLLGDTPWPGADRLAETTVPVLLVAGDHDPLCPLPTLYAFAARCKAPPRVVVVPGDHGLAKAKGDESETDDNVALCAAAAVLWARRLAAP